MFPDHSEFVVEGRIFTMNSSAPWAEAMHVRANGKLGQVSDRDTLSKALPDLPRVYAGSGLVLPGIIDMHNHVLESARGHLFDLPLRPSRSVEEIVADVGRAAKKVGKGEWIVGNGWGVGAVGAMNGPAALEQLDAVSGDNPVVLRDFSYHSRFANSLALARAGISAMRRIR